MANDSWYEKQYPKHKCGDCGLEHVMIPHYEHKGHVLAPFEVIGIVDGAANPGEGTPLDAPVHFIGLLWGFPGSREPQARSMVFLN